MPSRPHSWLVGYGEVESKLAYHDSYSNSSLTRGRTSPNESHPMLEEGAAESMRPLHAEGSEPSRTSTSQSPNDIPRDSGGQDPAMDLSKGRTPEKRLSLPPSHPSSFKVAPLSPLNPASRSDSAPSSVSSPFGRSNSRASAHIMRIPSEESRALAPPSSMSSMNPPASRASMILYRRVESLDSVLFPPSIPNSPTTRRSSMVSTNSFLSLSSDSKFPLGDRGLVAYAYDPSMDEYDAADNEDVLHDPNAIFVKVAGRSRSWRWLKNIAALSILVVGLLSLFIVLPVYVFYSDNGRNAMIIGNTRINSTGQAVPLTFDP